MLALRCAFLLAVLSFLGGAGPLRGQAAPPLAGLSAANRAVLEAIETMPKYGTYAASKAAFTGLNRAVTLNGGSLQVDASLAQPSFCSGATYLVFVRAMDRLSQQGGFTFDQATLSALLITGQRDGQGIWGRWNANGPGTARLFSELQIGKNFTDFTAARPGDFAKFFWNDEIGQKEHGHSVVYISTQSVGGQEFIRFWSSNLPTLRGDLSGYGYKVIPRSRIIRAIFSRLEEPSNLVRARSIPGTDIFLASLLSRRTTMDEVKRMCSF